MHPLLLSCKIILFRTKGKAQFFVKTVVMDSRVNKEEWINDVMDSLKGMEPLVADPAMHNKVMSKLNVYKQLKSNNVRLVVTRIAAAAVLLLLVNVASVLYHSYSTQNVENEQIVSFSGDDLSSLNEGNF